MEIVIIDWVDSQYTDGWENSECDSLLPAECQSVGYLVEEKSEYITLVQSESKTQMMNRLTIPRGAIKSIRKLQ